MRPAVPIFGGQPDDLLWRLLALRPCLAAGVPFSSGHRSGDHIIPYNSVICQRYNAVYLLKTERSHPGLRSDRSFVKSLSSRSTIVGSTDRHSQGLDSSITFQSTDPLTLVDPVVYSGSRGKHALESSPPVAVSSRTSFARRLIRLGAFLEDRLKSIYDLGHRCRPDLIEALCLCICTSSRSVN